MQAIKNIEPLIKELLLLPSPNHCFASKKCSKNKLTWLLNNNGKAWDDLNINWNKLSVNQLLSEYNYAMSLNQYATSKGRQAMISFVNYCQTHNEMEFLKKVLYFGNEKQSCKLNYQIYQAQYLQCIYETIVWQIQRLKSKHRNIDLYVRYIREIVVEIDKMQQFQFKKKVKLISINFVSLLIHILKRSYYLK